MMKKLTEKLFFAIGPELKAEIKGSPRAVEYGTSAAIREWCVRGMREDERNAAAIGTMEQAN
jgi:hypothetical protein